ncbi:MULTISPECIES: hypothetical protein [Limimaricola]|uniref:Uncharacterized protein n=2 Tax=Limimaricola TaxID=2211638 RepID=A0A2G1MCQ8_9RHOB|nr:MULTISPECIES: hypothetical protein [Limimaricola]MCP1168593.1 hypothetical protein [Limimaricola litoreus]PHP26526.1 hypothetical protein CJ301_15880 [Limimaricola cinnabarinus]
MTDKAYDTRSREEILAAEHFAPFRDSPGLDGIGLRALRTLDRFFGFAEGQGITVPGVADFLSFVAADTSTRRLDDLRTAFDRLLPAGTPVREVVREAIRQKRPRSRSCDRRDRETLRADPLMAPYRHLPTFDEVPLEDLRVLARFLTFADARGITVPTEADYLAFVADTGSSRRLRSLKAALDRLLPGNPAVHVVLAAAIARKSPKRPSAAGRKPRPAAMRRVASSDLPEAWQVLLGKMRLGALPMHQAVPAASVIDSMEDTLRAYARVQCEAGAEVAMTIEGVRRFEASRAADAAARAAPTYQAQGNRPATRHTAVMRLRQFGEALGLDPLLLVALRHHENSLRRELDTVVPLKFGRLDELPDLSATWSLATDLLEQSRQAPRRQTALCLLNAAAIIAIWTLLPLRLRDGQLLWGRDIRFDGTRYRVDIETAKEEEPLQGALHPVLTPFLDTLVLRGMEPLWLEEMRRRGMADTLPLFRGVDGRQLAASYPSTVWRKHIGTGAHISRARVHSELGQLGPEGVEMALALSAQRDPRSAQFYQGRAVQAAQRRQGQDMVDGLLAECLDPDPSGEAR